MTKPHGCNIKTCLNRLHYASPSLDLAKSNLYLAKYRLYFAKSRLGYTVYNYLRVSFIIRL